MRYEVITARHLVSLGAFVSFKMKSGWTPQGGIYGQPLDGIVREPIWHIGEDGEFAMSSENSTSDTNWCQAMILV